MRLQLRESLLYWLMRFLKARDTRDTSAAAFDPSQVRCILVISSTALGDTVMSTAAMVALRQRYPDAKIIALIHAAYVELFRRLPVLDEVIPYRGAWRGFRHTARQLKTVGCDLAVILHGNEPQATPLAWLSGARFIFKLPNTSAFRFLLSNRQPVLTWADLGHGMQQRLRVAVLAGANTDNARMALPIAVENTASVDAWLKQHGISDTTSLVGLQTGASSRGRMWPKENFIALARRLLETGPARRFILTGAPDEVAYCKEIAQAIGPAAMVAAGVFSVVQLPPLVARLSVLVTGDTGTLHVAVAVGTPTVSLFAISNPATSGPAYDLDRHIVIHRPCADRNVRSKTDDQTCISRITVAEVAAAVETCLMRGQA